MKLEEIVLEAAHKKGTYAGVKFDTETNKILHKYMKDNNIPNSVRPDKLHTTVLYSRKHLPNYKAPGKLEHFISGKPIEFEVWPTRPTDGSNPARCLVLRYDSPELVKRHNELMKQHDATYDFPDYKPHITLSYDIGDLDEKKFPDIKKYIDEITITDEYQEDLDLDWAKNKGLKKGN